MLKELCNAFGVSGAEDQVRDMIRAHAEKFCDTVDTDALGNLICYKKGLVDDKKIMLTSHMDEVGLIAHHVTKEGYVGFKAVGGIDPRVVVSKRVVFENGVKGVIGARPPHLNKNGEKDTPSMDSLLIDIGTDGKEETLKYIQPGDYIAFDSEFVKFGNCSIKAKGIDDRVGCYILMKLLEQKVYYDTYFTFTVQEEVGCRGAGVAASRIQPDYAIIVEGTTCSDVPFCEEYGYSTKFGGGGALSVMDGGSYSDRFLNQEIIQIAQKHEIKMQYKKTTMGGNDARAIQVRNSGIKTAVLSVPCRYIHSPVNVANKLDIESTYLLLSHLITEGLSCSY